MIECLNLWITVSLRPVSSLETLQHHRSLSHNKEPFSNHNKITTDLINAWMMQNVLFIPLWAHYVKLVPNHDWLLCLSLGWFTTWIHQCWLGSPAQSCCSAWQITWCPRSLPESSAPINGESLGRMKSRWWRGEKMKEVSFKSRKSFFMADFFFLTWVWMLWPETCPIACPTTSWSFDITQRLPNSPLTQLCVFDGENQTPGTG